MPGPKLTEKQELAIAALLTERTHADAATKAGVSLSAIRLWMKRPEFRAAYREARQEVLERTILYLVRSATDAAKTLRKCLKSSKDATAVRAAEVILANAYKGLESLELEDRITLLESAILAGSPSPVDPPPADPTPPALPEPSPPEAEPAVDIPPTTLCHVCRRTSSAPVGTKCHGEGCTGEMVAMTFRDWTYKEPTP